MSNRHGELFRLLDTWGAGVGFFTPLFRCAEVNSPCLQIQDAAGAIADFEPLARETYDGLPVPERRLQVGDAAVWAFVFDADDVVIGEAARARPDLEARLDSDFFRQRPLLGVEVAEFVQRGDARVQFARQAFERIAEGSARSARAWRDLSILTPDLVARLRTLPAELIANAVPDVKRVVAALDEGRVLVRGVNDDVHPMVLGPILEQIEGALRDLGGLYRELDVRTPAITFLKPGAAEVGGVPEFPTDAVVMVLDPRLAGLSEAINGERGGYFSLRAFDGTISPARIGTLQPRRVFSVAPLDYPLEDRPTGDLHFALRPARALSRKDRDLFSALPGNSVVIETPQAMNRRYASDAAVGAVRNAAAALTTIRETRDGIGPTDRAFFLQASGVGPDPALDAWCQLYARAHRLDLVGAPGCRFYLGGGSEQAEVARPVTAMFPGLELIDMPPVGRARRPGACGVLLSDAPAEPAKAQHVHRYAIESVLIYRGWTIPDPGDPRGAARTLFVRGQAGDFDCETAVTDKIHGAGRDWYNVHLEARPLAAKRVLVTEDAGGAEILCQLATIGQLLVSLRDVALANPAMPPLVGLLSGQMRRFTNSLPSRTRTSYLAMVAHAAFTDGSIRFDQADDLEAMLTSSAIGQELDLTCRSISYASELAVANMRVVERSPSFQAAAPVLEFKLIFGPDGLSLVGALPDDAPIRRRAA